jgi:transcription factor CP2-like protein
MESELIDQWRDQRHSERILEVDIPLSYGITEVMNDPLDINKCSFLWDTSKETGIFIKVNCISTEFTPKKHGGEKGVPFRVIIETHGIFTAETPSLLHAASSQVKVFKPKGADRKHKTDREKLSKKSQSSGELDKYRPSYDHTVFTEIPLDQFYSSSFPDVGLNRSSTPVKRSSSPAAAVVSPERKFFALSQGSQSSNGSKTEGGPLDFTNSQSRSIIRSLTSSIASTSLSSEDIKSGLISSLTRRATISPHSPSSSNHSHNNLIPIAPDSIETPSVKMSNFLEDSNPSQVTQFLLFNRFDRHIKTFNNYSGSDLLRLTRSDLIHLCNSDSDGIRLYNLLHHHPRRHPKCVIYVTFASKTEEEPEFSAIYLENLTEKELRSKLGNILTEDERSSQGNTTVSAPNSISRIKMKGPLGIPISVTDDVVHNIQSESMFTLAFEKGEFSYFHSKISLKLISSFNLQTNRWKQQLLPSHPQNLFHSTSYLNPLYFCLICQSRHLDIPRLLPKNVLAMK